MLGGLYGEGCVADNPDERRDDHELEQAEVVDLGDLQLMHPVQQRRAPLVALQREQLLEHQAFAVMTIAESALEEQALVAVEGVGQAASTGTDTRRAVSGSRRSCRGAQIVRGKRRAFELANEPEDVVGAAERIACVADRLFGGEPFLQLVEHHAARAELAPEPIDQLRESHDRVVEQRTAAAMAHQPVFDFPCSRVERNYVIHGSRSSRCRRAPAGHQIYSAVRRSYRAPRCAQKDSKTVCEQGRAATA
jgi:hypothetical protein